MTCCPRRSARRDRRRTARARASSSPPPSAIATSTSPARHVVGHDDRDVLDAPAGTPTPATNCAGPGASSASRSRSSSNADRVVQVPLARDQRVQLADPAELALVARCDDRRRAARVQERPLAGLGPPLDAGRLEHRLDAGPSRGRSRPAPRGVRQPRGPRPVSSAPRWWRSPDGQRHRRAALGIDHALERRRRAVHVRRLEQRDVGAPARGVVLRGVEQARQQQRAHHAHVLAHRVRQPQRGQLAQPQLRERLGRGEAPRDHLEQAVVAQLVLDAAHAASAPASAGRPRRGAPASSSAPCRGRTRARSPRSGRPRAGRRRRASTARRRPTRPRRPRRPRSRAARGSRATRPRAPRRRSASSTRASRSRTLRSAQRVRVVVDRARHQARAAQLDHQARRQPLRGHRRARDAAASRSARWPRCAAAACLGSARMFGADPGRGLHQHARGLVRHLGDLAAHDPGDAADGPSASQTSAIDVVELALDAVERAHLLARLRACAR